MNFKLERWNFRKLIYQMISLGVNKPKHSLNTVSFATRENELEVAWVILTFQCSRISSTPFQTNTSNWSSSGPIINPSSSISNQHVDMVIFNINSNQVSWWSRFFYKLMRVAHSIRIFYSMGEGGVFNSPKSIFSLWYRNRNY